MPFCMAVNPKLLLWGMTENLGKEKAFLELLWNQSMRSRCIFPAWVFVCLSALWFGLYLLWNTNGWTFKLKKCQSYLYCTEVRGRVSIGPTQSWLVSRIIIGDVKEIQGLVMLQKHSIPFQQGLFCLGELEKSRMPYNSPVEISLSCLLFSAVMYFSVILKMNGLYFPSFTMHHSVFPWSESLHVTS